MGIKSLININFRGNSLSRVAGIDGLLSFFFTLIILIATFGIPLFVFIFKVYKKANAVNSPIEESSVLLVFGMSAVNGKLQNDYLRRLDKAKELYKDNNGSKILILGGKTADHHQTEAEMGKEYLLQFKIPDGDIFLENSSRITLENIQRAKSFLSNFPDKKTVFITNRYHLARTAEMAKGFGIHPALYGAEQKFELTVTSALRILWEAFNIFWYLVGKLYANITGNKGILSKIS